MKGLNEKIEYLKRLTGVDILLHGSGDNNGDGKRVFIPIISRGKNVYASVPVDTDVALKNLIAAYFVDTETKSHANESERIIFRMLSGIASADEIARLDEKMCGKKYFAVLFKTYDSAKWSELISYLTALSSERDLLIKTEVNGLMYLKYCDGSYGGSEELAEVLRSGICGDRKINLTVVSGGSVSGADSLVSAYSRLLTAYSSCDGEVRHYRDCLLSEIVKTLPQKDAKKFAEYISEGKIRKGLSYELIETANVFLECDLSVAATAKKLFLHRNTLAARLDKIKQEIGLDIKKYRQAVLFELIMNLRKALGEN